MAGSVSGRTETLETLSPSGRVLARTVTDMATNTITENVVFGYASGSDSPAYSKNLMTNVVSTYLGSVNYTGTTGSWPISNAHGDTVGVTDVNATFVANAPTDEYGRGVAPADRLGWLGAHYRFNIGGTQNLTRMGVRLYDPNLGRFLQVDPVEGGTTTNDYGYMRDPINEYDLNGEGGNAAGCTTQMDHPDCNKARGGPPKKSGWWGGPDVGGMICGLLCIGVEVNNGHACVDWGVGLITGASLGLAKRSSRVKKRGMQASSLQISLGLVDVSLELRPSKTGQGMTITRGGGRSVSGGRGLMAGAARTYQACL